MEEIRLWKISNIANEKAKAVPVETIGETTTEKLLEDVLTGSPDVLMPNLRLVGRQTETPGGPLDLLGVDEDGHLVVFELKRGDLTRDAVAQAIDYASYLADLEIDDLCRHIASSSGKGGTETIDDFAQWYQSHFQRPVSDIGRPRVVLVGLGVDERAKRMVAFLAQCELDISLLTFHGFTQGSETLLARQVEVQARQDVVTVRSTKRENQAKLDQLLASLGIQANYEAMASALRLGLGSSTYQWTNPTGYSFYLPEVSATGGPTTRAYLAIYLSEKQKGSVQLLFQTRAVEAIGDAELHRFASALGSKAVVKPNGLAELWIDVTKPATSYAEALSSIGQAIAAGWKSKMETQAKAEAEGMNADRQPNAGGPSGSKSSHF
jgi:hypothetical protein